MNQLIKPIHSYSGLLSFTALVIFGLIGIAATLLPPPGQRPKPERTVQALTLEIPGDLDDRELADHIQAWLNLPLTGPAPDWALRRDSEHNLRFRLPTPAYAYDVTVFEGENRIVVEKVPFDHWQYLFHLHEMTPSRSQPDLRTLCWAYYMEFNVWALLLMGLSGLYLWLSSNRRKMLWAQASFLGGTLAFAVFYLLLR